MKIKLDPFFELLMNAYKTGFDYDLSHSLRVSPELSEFLADIDPELELIHSQQSYYGLPDLRKQVVETQGYAVSEDNIYITAGSNEANFLVMAQRVEPGDEVVIDMPSWPQPYSVCEALGAKIKVIKRKEELGWGIDLDELKSLVSPATKLIYICSPNNPTGAVFNESEMKEICEIARANDAYFLSDEVYRGLEWDRPLSPAAVNYYEKAVSTSSVSKTLGLQGIRTGWLATHDRELIDDCLALRKLSSEIMEVLGEQIALLALKPKKYNKLLREAKEEGTKNWDIVSDWISKSHVFSWVKPKAGFLSFPKYELDIGSMELYSKLLVEPYRTFLLPGAVYGFEKHVRIGVGALDPRDTKKALGRIDKLIEVIKM